ncbi:MAG: ATP-binding cassette domain-containing protein [Candidatus Dormiibacterota bacterium]
MISEISLEHVTVSAGGREILHDVNLVVRQGESLAITGPSGSGKTTLLMLAAGLQLPSQGRVLVDGQRIGTDEKSRQRFGVVLQNHGLVSVLTAAENVALPLQARGVPTLEVARMARAGLDAVGLHAAADALVQDLSGGQQQRVAVARALAGSPDAVLADEPTSELVAEQRKVIVALLLHQAREGRILVMASHDPEVVGECDSQVWLVDGRRAGSAIGAPHP